MTGDVDDEWIMEYNAMYWSGSCKAPSDAHIKHNSIFHDVKKFVHKLPVYIRSISYNMIGRRQQMNEMKKKIVGRKKVGKFTRQFPIYLFL